MSEAAKKCLFPPHMPKETRDKWSFADILYLEYMQLKKAQQEALTLRANWHWPSISVSPTSPQRWYRQHTLEYRFPTHGGQCKLALCEMEYLIRFGHLSKTIVYAGAAEGTHLVYLSQLFPEHTFYLIDPRGFDLNLQRCHNVKINVDGKGRRIASGKMDDPVASTFASKRAHLWSDIRSGDPVKNKTCFAQKVQEDMQAQRRWTRFFVLSMLKLRLPYEPGQSTYCAPWQHKPEHLWWEVYAPESTTELRLICNGKEECRWDHLTVEQQCAYFNTCTRVCCYEWDYVEPPIAKQLGLDHCWDCTQLRRITLSYLCWLRGFPLHTPTRDMWIRVFSMCTQPSEELWIVLFPLEPRGSLWEISGSIVLEYLGQDVWIDDEEWWSFLEIFLRQSGSILEKLQDKTSHHVTLLQTGEDWVEHWSHCHNCPVPPIRNHDLLTGHPEIARDMRALYATAREPLHIPPLLPP